MLTSEAFSAARYRVLGENYATGGIGRLGERSLHKILKFMIDPDESHHEVALCGKVADIFDGTAVTEVQTRSFEKMPKKLEAFLPTFPVTIVHPLAQEKTLRWLNPETGEIGEPRRSPKHQRASDALPELYRLGEWVCHPELTVRLLFFKMEEYRLQNGWDKTGKRGSHRIERFPSSFLGEVTLADNADYARAFLPDTLPASFTVKEYAKAVCLTPKKAYYGIRVLLRRGIITQTGKRGAAYLYART